MKKDFILEPRKYYIKRYNALYDLRSVWRVAIPSPHEVAASLSEPKYIIINYIMFSFIVQCAHCDKSLLLILNV